MEAPRQSRASPLCRSAPSPRTSSVSARSAARPSARPRLPHRGHLPAARAAAEALRHLRPPSSRATAGGAGMGGVGGGAGITARARARAASSGPCHPAEGGGNRGHVTARRVPRGGASREAAGLPAGARARAPAPTCPCGLGECGSRSRAASRVPARRRRLSAHYVMPRHAPSQPTGARALLNVNTARTWLARPGHVRGGPGRRHRAALRRGREPGGPPRGGGNRVRGGFASRSSPPPARPGDTLGRRPRECPKWAASDPSAGPRPAAVRLLPAFTSMVPSGRGLRPPASRRGGSSASRSAPRRPGLEAAGVAGPPHGRGAGTGGRGAGCRGRRRRPASGAPRGVPDNKSAARRLPAASAPRRRGRLTGRAAATM